MSKIKTYVAGADIARYTPVKFHTTAGQVVKATTGADEVIGVTTEIDVVAGERVDVIHAGEAFVATGAAVAAGKLLMADATSRAVAAAAGAGSNVRTFGMAVEASLAAADVIRAEIAIGSFQG